MPPRPRKIPEPNTPTIKAPHVQGPFDPPAALEGPNNGLTEALAEFLWLRFGGEGLMTLRETVHPMEADGWRRIALQVIQFMIGKGFRGPGGLLRDPPDWNYAWLYESATWEVLDGQGGVVCLVPNEADIPLLLAAPRMLLAIRNTVQRARARGGITRADLAALEASIENLNFVMPGGESDNQKGG